MLLFYRMPNFDELLTIALRKNNHTLSNGARDKLARYLELLHTWNRSFNLTSITEPAEMVSLHIMDSLAVAPYLQGQRALDVGSGAGLPGIPLAIACPETNWTLLDKNGKKTRFLTQVIAELGLQNIKAVHSRCEDFQPSVCFDSILSRAFGSLALFVETTAHLLCSNGIFIAMKGKYPDEELAELPNRFITQHVTRLEIKGIMAERHIVCIGRSE
jgi:16S rRNA (guanine527-N7)-methyltransferase